MKKGIKKRTDKLTVCWLTTNRKCNLRCNYCYAQAAGFNDESDLTPDMTLKICELLKQTNVNHSIMVGGEPSINPDIIEIINILKEKGLTTSMISNGLKFADFQFAKDMVDAGMWAIVVSMKATNRDEYSAITGADCFHKVLKAIDNLKQLGAHMTVCVNFTSRMLPDIEKTLSEMLQFGIERIGVDFTNPVILENEEIKADGIPDPFEIAEGFARAYKFLSNHKVDYYINPSVPLCLLPLEEKRGAIEKQVLLNGCQMRMGHGVIFLSNGDLIPCNEFTGQALGKYGVDFSTAEEFEEFWNGPVLTRYLKSCHFYPYAKCEQCSDWPICGGGCPIKWLYFKPQEYINSIEKRNVRVFN